jgi:hypothetical protein
VLLPPTHFTVMRTHPRSSAGVLLLCAPLAAPPARAVDFVFADPAAVRSHCRRLLFSRACADDGRHACTTHATPHALLPRCRWRGCAGATRRCSSSARAA